MSKINVNPLLDSRDWQLISFRFRYSILRDLQRQLSQTTRLSCQQGAQAPGFAQLSRFAARRISIFRFYDSLILLIVLITELLPSVICSGAAHNFDVVTNIVNFNNNLILKLVFVPIKCLYSVSQTTKIVKDPKKYDVG